MAISADDIQRGFDAAVQELRRQEAERYRGPVEVEFPWAQIDSSFDLRAVVEAVLKSAER